MKKFNQLSTGKIGSNLVKLQKYSKGDEFKEKQYQRAREQFDTLVKNYNKNKSEYELNAKEKNASLYKSSL